MGHYGSMLVQGHDRPQGMWTVTGDRRDATFQIISTPELELTPQSLWELEVIDSFASPAVFPKAISFDGTHLWVGADQLYKTDVNGTTLLSGALPYTGFGPLTFDGNHFWNFQTDENTLHELVIEEGLVTSVLDSFSSPGPVPAGLSFDGTYLWSASAVTDKIYKIDTTGTIVKRFDSPGTLPTGLAYDGTFLWNADADEDKIYKMDLSEDIIDSPGPYPTGMATDGTHLWVADDTNKKIYKINSAGTILDSFNAPGGGSSGVGGLAYDGEYLWNANWKLDKIYKLDTAGTVVASFNSPGGWPMGLAWDGTFLWNVDFNDRKIYQLTTTGAIISSFNTPALVFSPRGLAFDGTCLWLVNWPNRIYKLTTGGTVLDEFGSPGSSPFGLTFHQAKLWNSDNLADKLYEMILAAAPVIASFDSPGTFPYGLAFDGICLWNADSDTNSIYKLSTTGIVLSQVASPMDDPSGLTFDGSSLWSMDMMAAKIFKHNATGMVMASLDSPGLYPSGLTYDGTAWWTADAVDGTVSQIDITEGLNITSLNTIEGIPSNLSGLTHDNEYLWVSQSIGFGQDSWFVRYDKTGFEVDTWKSPGYAPGALCFDGNFIWHADKAEDLIFKMDPYGNIVDFYDYPGFDITDMAAGSDGIWAVDSAGGMIYQLNKPGRVNVGSSRGRTFTIKSTGQEDLVLGSLAITGTHAEEFNLLDDTCSGQIMAQDTDCTFWLEFSPSVPGEMQASLEIPSNIGGGVTLTMPLNGTGGMGCSGDFEPDGDVDGMDLANYLIDSNGISLAEFSSYFGRNDCMEE